MKRESSSLPCPFSALARPSVASRQPSSSRLTISTGRYVFAQFQTNVRQLNDDSIRQYRSIPTFLTLFIFAFLYELVLVWDALRMKNTIQIIGLALANLAILVYTAIQIDQIGNAINILASKGAIINRVDNGPDLWSTIRPFLVAIPCIIAVASVFMAFISWKLYQEFAWDILKQIGADYRMKKRFLHYQVCQRQGRRRRPEYRKC